jgi:hypothetical protein
VVENPPAASSGNQGKGPLPASPGWLWGLWSGFVTTTAGVRNWILASSQSLVVIITFFALLITPGTKDVMLGMMAEYYCLYQYLNYGDQRLLVGLLHEKLGELDGEGYRRIHVFSYSFASVVAINALFPRGQPPYERFKEVDTLVTVGCPFDMIRTFWSRYFLEREAKPNVPKKWLNVYSMSDILSSNFRDDRDHDQQPKSEVVKAIFSPATHPESAGEDVCGSAPGHDAMPTPINLPMYSETDFRDFSFIETITLFGLKSHSSYWNRTDVRAESCFDAIIKELYRDDQALTGKV